MTTGLQVRMSQQYRSLIKDCQEQLEHLAAQSSHYLAQVFRFTFIVASFYKSVAVGVDVQAGVDLAPCGDPVHGQQPGGGSSCPTSLTGSLFISLPVRNEPGMSPQAVTCICEVIFLQVRPVTGRRQPGAAWGLLGGGHPVCPPGSR